MINNKNLNKPINSIKRFLVTPSCCEIFLIILIIKGSWNLIIKQRNWVFATNSDFLITLSLEPNVADLRYFKLLILLNLIIWVWNIKGLQHRVLKILRIKYLILFKRLNSFVFNAGLELIPSIINIYNYFHFCNSIREFFFASIFFCCYSDFLQTW